MNVPKSSAEILAAASHRKQKNSKAKKVVPFVGQMSTFSAIPDARNELRPSAENTSLDEPERGLPVNNLSVPTESGTSTGYVQITRTGHRSNDMTPPTNSYEHLLSPNWKSHIAEWLAEDTPSFDYGGYVVGEVERHAFLLGKGHQPAVLAGSPFVTEIFAQLGCKLGLSINVRLSLSYLVSQGRVARSGRRHLPACEAYCHCQRQSPILTFRRTYSA